MWRAKLSDADNRYKIKRRQSGYRLIYQVKNHIVTVTVLTIGEANSVTFIKINYTLYI